MSILIITRSDDNASVDMVARAIGERGDQAIRLNTDKYPEHLRVSTRFVDGKWEKILATDRERENLEDVTALWYRRYFAGGGLPDSLGDTRSACVSEARRTLYGVIASLGCFELDPLMAVRGADHKELQLKRAAEFGLEIPNTLFTNDPAEVRRFFHEHEGKIITKMQSSFAIYRSGEEQVVFTNALKEEDLDDLHNIKYSPMIFQNLVPKKMELRSTVVGRQVFTACIDSQRSEVSEVDWRRDGVGLIDDWQDFELPEPVKEGLLAVTEAFGLNYAAADFIVTEDGRYIFLEINAGGEWFWLQRAPGLPIAEALADTLLGRVPRAKQLGISKAPTP
jgi:glutathione synthase/RimK-type ligase-like ATP-grasp enzyme